MEKCASKALPSWKKCWKIVYRKMKEKKRKQNENIHKGGFTAEHVRGGLTGVQNIVEMK